MVPIFLSRPTAIEYALSTATAVANTNGTHCGSLPRRVAAAPEERKKVVPVIHCLRRCLGGKHVFPNFVDLEFIEHYFFPAPIVPPRVGEIQTSRAA